MDKLSPLIKKIVKITGREPKGNLPKPLYDLVRRDEPMLCVDAALIPNGKKPSVLLLKRSPHVIAPEKYYTVGGRLPKERHITKAMRDKILAETGLKCSVGLKDIMGFGLARYPPSRKEKRDFTVVTASLCFAIKLPKQFEKKIKAGDGNTSWKVFDKIGKNWDSYVMRAVAAAWDRCYGKGWRKGLDKKIKRILADYSDFVPLKLED